MKGKLEYTQHTVAWHGQPMRSGSVVEEINVGFNAPGGGTYGEFQIHWHDFSSTYGQRSRSRPLSMRVLVFQDGMKAFLSPEIQSVMSSVNRMRTDCTVQRMIALLEEQGARPSSYHLRGIRNG